MSKAFYILLTSLCGMKMKRSWSSLKGNHSGDQLFHGNDPSWSSTGLNCSLDWPPKSSTEQTIKICQKISCIGQTPKSSAEQTIRICWEKKIFSIWIRESMWNWTIDFTPVVISEKLDFSTCSFQWSTELAFLKFPTFAYLIKYLSESEKQSQIPTRNCRQSPNLFQKFQQAW